MDLSSDGTFLNSTPSFIKLWISYSFDGRKTSVHKELSVHTRYAIYLVYLSPI